MRSKSLSVDLLVWSEIYWLGCWSNTQKRSVRWTHTRIYFCSPL